MRLSSGSTPPGLRSPLPRTERIRLTWPGMFTDMTLQAATEVGSPEWAEVVTVGNGVELDAAVPARFFRLVKH